MAAAESQKQIYEFDCYPVKETYYNANTRFGVYRFYTKTNLPKSSVAKPIIEIPQGQYYESNLVGKMGRLHKMVPVHVRAVLTFSKKYDQWQYDYVGISFIPPKTIHEQMAYVKSLSGVGDRGVKALFTRYPNIIHDILNGKDNVDTGPLPGFGSKTYERLRNGILRDHIIADVDANLKKIGVSHHDLAGLYHSMDGMKTIADRLLKNPYLVAQIKDIDFKQLDRIAVEFGPSNASSPRRLAAFVRDFLILAGEDYGHTKVPISELQEAAEKDVPECEKYLIPLLEMEHENPRILFVENGFVGRLEWYRQEKQILDDLCAISECQVKNHDDQKALNAIQTAEDFLGFTLTKEQSENVHKILSSNLSLLCGAAGTGKTSILAAVLRCFPSDSVVCAALSAKAAQRIKEATGFNASTIHKLLGSSRGRFVANRNNPLDADLVVVDECSMINAELFSYLVEAVKPGTSLILCGDDRQLPPIGHGNVFSDLLEKKKENGELLFNVTRLTKVMRQAMGSGILTDANIIRDGHNPLTEYASKIVSGNKRDMVYLFPETKERMKEIAIETFLKAVSENGPDEVALLVPRKDNCVNCSSQLNREILDRLYPPGNRGEVVTFNEKVFCVGAKVIQRENDYRNHVMNGETGYVIAIEKSKDDDRQKTLSVCFGMGGDENIVKYTVGELRNLDLGYAMTVHLSQGSGYKTVIIVMDTSHYSMLDSCMLYTAITRAKKRCLLLTDRTSFQRCINSTKAAQRNTWLPVL